MLRSFRLMSIAAQAEGVLLRRQGATMGRAAVLSFAAAAFGLAALISLHAAGWIFLEERYGALAAALWLTLADALIAALLIFLAKPRHDPVAEEALKLREQSLSLLTAPASQGGGPEWERLLMQAVGVAVERWLKR